jgi:hypothetical protein
VEVYSTRSLASALDGGEWSVSRPRERAPGTHWIGGWAGPRAVPDAVVKRKPRTPIVQPVAQRYTGSAIMVLSEHSKGKGKVAPVLIGGSGNIAPRILNLGTSWREVSGHLHVPVALPTGKEPLPPVRIG